MSSDSILNKIVKYGLNVDASALIESRISRPMETEAAAVGSIDSEVTGRKHPRLQILTLAELFGGKKPDIPWVDASVLKSAKREDRGKQGTLL